MPAKSTSQKEAWDVLKSREGLTFLGSVLVVAIMSIAVAYQVDPTESLIYMTLIAAAGMVSLAAWIALTLATFEDDIDSLFAVLGITCALLLPLAWMLLGASGWNAGVLLIVNLVVWNSLGVALAKKEAKASTGWEMLLLGVLVCWGVTATFVTIGSLPYSGFSQDLRTWIVTIGFLADLRWLFGIAAGILLFGTAVFRALRLGVPELVPIAAWKVPTPKDSGLMSALVVPMITVLNGLLLVANILTDLAWKAIRHLAIFFGRVGQEFVALVAGFAKQTGVWFRTFQTSAVFALAVACIVLVDLALPGEVSYLQLEEWSSQLTSLAWLAVLSFGCLAAIWLGTALGLADDFKEAVSNLEISGRCATTGLGWLIMVYFVAGLVVHGFHYVFEPVPGFSKPGLFTIVLLLFVSGGVIHAIRNNLAK